MGCSSQELGLHKDGAEQEVEVRERVDLSDLILADIRGHGRSVFYTFKGLDQGFLADNKVLRYKL